MISATLIVIWAAVAVTIYVQDFARLPLRIRFGAYRPFNRKPFNCEACLPLWLVAAFLPIAIYLHYGVPVLLFIASACTAGIIAALLLKLIRK